MKLAGNCPMGCGTTLMVGKEGHITCSWYGCPNPAAVDELLSDPLSHVHVVTFKAESFDIQHPLAERGEDLVECGLHQHIRLLDGPPCKPGRYIATYVGESPDGHWRWEEIGASPAAS